MSARFKVPSEAEMSVMLGMLFDGMDIKPGNALGIPDSAYCGVYVDDSDQPVTVCVCDIGFAAYSACSLTMLPKPVAEDAIASGGLEGNQLGNLGEVFNILSRLFMSNDTDHLRFTTLYKASDLPGDLKDAFAEVAKQASFEIDIPRYGSGTVNLMVA